MEVEEGKGELLADTDADADGGVVVVVVAAAAAVGIRLASTTLENAPRPRLRTTSQQPLRMEPGSASCAGVTLAGVLLLSAPEASFAAALTTLDAASPEEVAADIGGDLLSRRSGGSVGNRDGGSRIHLELCESVGLAKGESCSTVCRPKTVGPLEPDRVRLCVYMLCCCVRYACACRLAGS